MLDSAGYAIERQYDALLFHYYWTVPYLGSAPGEDGKLQVPSILGTGIALKYSWKWNTTASSPDIRYTLEAMNRFSGTEMDPLNQDPARELLHRLKATLPSIDLTWSNHFFSTLYDHDRSKYMEESKAGARFTTTVMMAVEFVEKGPVTKTYFIPRKLGHGHGQIPIAMWEDSLAQLDPQNAARGAMYEFMKTDPEGRLLSPL
ncbi:hypothetical protein CDD83_6403 [Cordyceps sp. RAO-2017]|nr:hypothetical protein CDD83_6403 [Cordyceps sp. RAO-2017]